MHSEIEGPVGAPEVVCLHGGIGTGRFHWSRQVDWLAERFRVHLPDLPGHGGTRLDGSETYSRALLASAVEDYLQGLDTPPHVAAFSMGGHAALHLAERRPGLFASLTVVGVAIRDHDGLGGWRERFDPDRLQAEYPMFANALSKLHEPQGGPEAWREVCRRDAGSELEVTADLDALAALAAPVLLVRGDRDPVADPAQYAELREVWPQSEELVVPAGGHDVQLTRHELVQPALRDFLERAADSSAEEDR